MRYFYPDSSKVVDQAHVKTRHQQVSNNEQSLVHACWGTLNWSNLNRLSRFNLQELHLIFNFVEVNSATLWHI